MTTEAAQFTPPKALAELIEAALSHGRSFIVQHNNSGDSPFVTFRAKWLPEGCDVTTEVTLTWHTRSTGTYRLFTAIARGYYQDWHDISAKKALSLVTGASCFFRRDVHAA
ncbi:hypothetical protein [Nocardia xishanensis]|uniref:hypothetical protein n=1 Tax=Nocardia xishanensis TaxID=238964 RepID=UPI00082D78E0|nr:hypothetical protein [Nocardia xishanensis]